MTSLLKQNQIRKKKVTKRYLNNSNDVKPHNNIIRSHFHDFKDLNSNFTTVKSIKTLNNIGLSMIVILGWCGDYLTIGLVG